MRNWFRLFSERVARVLDFSGKTGKKKKRRFLFEVELLERRDLLSTLSFAQPVVRVSAGSNGTNSATFTVNLSPPSTQQVTVLYGTADGASSNSFANALHDRDYKSQSGTLTFQPGQTSQSVSVPIMAQLSPTQTEIGFLTDPSGVQDESFNVQLTGATNATIAGTSAGGQATGIILNDSVPSVWIDSPSVTENSQSATVHVHLTDAYPFQIPVSYVASGGSAGSGNYTSTSGALTFQPGQTDQSFPVAVRDDGQADPTLTVNLSTSASSSTNFVYQLYSDVFRRAADSGAAGWIQVANQTPNGRGLATAGFLASTEYLSRVVSDFYSYFLRRAPDPVGLSNYVTALQSSTNLYGIMDCEAAIIGSQEYFANAGSDNTKFVKKLYNDLLHRDGDTGGVTGWVGTLSRGVSRTAVALGFEQSTEADQKIVSYEYTALLHRQAEQGAWLSTLQATGHRQFENFMTGVISSAEYFGRIMASSSAIGMLSILDSDSTVSIAATTSSISESGTTPGTFTLTRTGNTSANLTVFYTLQGSATSGVDYAALPGFVVIPQGTSSATISISPIDTHATGSAKTVIATVTATPTSAYTLASQHQATMNIVEGDVGLVITQNGGATLLTSASPTATYTIALNTQPTANVTVSVAAAFPFLVAPSTLSFTSSNWAAPQTVTVSSTPSPNSTAIVRSGLIAYTVSSADVRYQGLLAQLPQLPG